MLIILQHLCRGLFIFISAIISSAKLARAHSHPTLHQPSLHQPSHLDQIHLIHLNVKVHYPDTEMQVLKCNWAIEWYIISSHRAAEWRYWCGEEERGAGEVKPLIWFLVCLTKAITFNLMRTVSPLPVLVNGTSSPATHSALINGGHLQPFDHFDTSKRIKEKERVDVLQRGIVAIEIIHTEQNCPFRNFKTLLYHFMNKIDSTCRGLKPFCCCKYHPILNADCLWSQHKRKIAGQHKHINISCWCFRQRLN